MEYLSFMGGEMISYHPLELKLKQEHIERALRFLPEVVKALLISKRDGLVLAGGFFRSLINTEPIKDIDLFSKSKDEAGLNFSDLLTAKWGNSIAKTIKTQNSYTAKEIEGYDVQFIHRWCYPTAKELIDSFDFSIARAAMWWNGTEWDSIVDHAFYYDVYTKTIRFMNPTREEEPAGSMMRVLKFNRMGYSIDSSNLSLVIMKLVEGSRKNNPNRGTSMETNEAAAISYSLSRCGGGS